jgi:hypothetical protein
MWGKNFSPSVAEIARDWTGNIWQNGVFTAGNVEMEREHLLLKMPSL